MANSITASLVSLFCIGAFLACVIGGVVLTNYLRNRQARELYGRDRYD